MNSKNEIIIYDNYAEILLYDKKGVEKARAVIDVEDIEKIKGYKWRFHNKKGYAMTTISKKNIGLHRFILDYKGILEVDHIDGQPLNNRKTNLRIVTHQQNTFNRGVRSNNKSGKTGVFFDKTKNKWRAYIQINGKTIHLGYYNDYEKAVKARIEGEIKYFGEYRRK